MVDASSRHSLFSRDSHDRGSAISSKTSYHIVHSPPWKLRDSLGFRPKLLFQIQQTSSTSRPVPILDISQSSSSSPRAFLIHLGCNEGHISVVKSEWQSRDSSHEERSSTETEILATMRLPWKTTKPPRKGRSDINVAGQVWKAESLQNGSYEFQTTGADGQLMKLRWVVRHKKEHGEDARKGDQPRSGNVPKTLRFSVINANTRCHPVIASIKGARLEILDRYRPSLSADSGAEDAPAGEDSDSEEEGRLSPKEVPVTEDLRRLIFATGVWVILQEDGASYR